MKLSTARGAAASFAVLLVVLFGPLGAMSAWAQSPSTFGVRAGVSGGPNQFFVGGHFETGPIAPHLTFRPNAEVGFGDGITLLTLNLEFVYHWPLKHQPWTIYAGGGPSAVIGDFHKNGSTDFGGGFNMLVGLQAHQGFFTELKLGLIDSPEVKFTVGYVFHKH
jgi:hypothetical protein